MPPTAAISAFGTLLKIGDGGSPSETFTTIAEVRDITGPGLKQEQAEVTAHDGSGWDEYVATILRGGEVTFDINYVPTNATHNNTAGLVRDLRAKNKRNFQLVFPGPTTWAFTALVAQFQPKAPVNGQLQASVTLRITAAPTLV